MKTYILLISGLALLSILFSCSPRKSEYDSTPQKTEIESDRTTPEKAIVSLVDIINSNRIEFIVNKNINVFSLLITDECLNQDFASQTL